MRLKISHLIVVFSLFSVGVFSQALPEGYPHTERSKVMLTAGWKFHLGDPEAAYYATDFDDASWQSVSVPHTLALTSLALNGVRDSKVQETFQREVGWYKRTIKVTADSSKSVF
ncbi:hypothetical protein RS130_11975 [Paraglaciecola aquimarina]|uniref:Beta-galactosidase n=1 Tax=Paraglaciecola aquimarina TaxID=1235557 RepID=A0ABU3SX49_9ALTE|nr:hypothetical protein [Paraglaciecola aquimarina]MDU0354557.1 hypothetical protein [Paraglaciecola aquimarina]